MKNIGWQKPPLKLGAQFDFCHGAPMEYGVYFNIYCMKRILSALGNPQQNLKELGLVADFAQKFCQNIMHFAAANPDGKSAT